MSARDPGHGEVLNDAIEAALDAVFVWLPARVVAFDATTQTADVQPIPKVRHLDEDGAVVITALPVIPGRPVLFHGGGGFGIQFPMTVGDEVVILFSAASLDKWFGGGSGGGGNGAVDPESHARHALADAVVLPGLRNLRTARANPPTTTIVVGKEGETRQPAALGGALDTFVSGNTVTPTADPTCLRGFLTAIAAYVNALAPGTLPINGPAAPGTLTSDTVEVTE